jgi:hypothetical protein
MTDTYKILGQGLSGDLLAPGSTVRKATVYEVPENTKAAVSAINITNSGDEEVTYDLAFVKDADVSLETENVNVNIYNFKGFVVHASGSSGKYSADGATWQDITFPGSTSSHSRKVVYGNGRYVAMSYDMNSMGGPGTNWSTSVDGLNWTTISNLNNNSPKSMKFINNKFFTLFDYNSTIVTSEDGLTWTTISPQYESAGMNNIIANDIAYGNGMYVLIDNMSGDIYYSSDLVSWTRKSINVSSYRAITFAIGKFLAVGGYGFAYSENGIDWTTYASPASESGGVSVVYGGGKFVVNGGSGYPYGTVVYSVDGINWSSASHSDAGGNFMTIGNIIYANGIFLLGGGNAPLKKSTDGITWTLAGVGDAMTYMTWGAAGEEFVVDSYSIPKTLSKHRIVARKTIAPGETQEIKGGITLSAGDQIRLISSADEIITNVYGVEIS